MRVSGRSPVRHRGSGSQRCSRRAAKAGFESGRRQAASDQDDTAAPYRVDAPRVSLIEACEFVRALEYQSPRLALDRQHPLVVRERGASPARNSTGSIAARLPCFPGSQGLVGFHHPITVRACEAGRRLPAGVGCAIGVRPFFGVGCRSLAVESHDGRSCTSRHYRCPVVQRYFPSSTAMRRIVCRASVGSRDSTWSAGARRCSSKARQPASSMVTSPVSISVSM